jgi:hypothetical protein
MIVSELFAKLGFKVDQASYSRADAVVGSLKRGLAAIGGAFAAGAVVKGLKSLVEQTGATAIEAGRAAQRIGLTRQAFEELKHAADESGVSVGSFETGVGMMARQMAEVTQGNKTAAEAFRRAGVSVRDSSGALRGTDEVLMDLSERFAAMPDGPKKTALAMQIFSRSGREMIPMLNAGRAGMEAWRAEARELGIVFSDEDVAAAEELRQATSLLDDVLEGLKRRIGVSLMPALAKLKTDFAKWILANRELIKQRVVAFAEGLGKALKYAAQMVEPLARFISWLASNGPLAAAALLALGLAINSAFIIPAGTILLVLALVEELWGWIKGTRNTLLEDMFGPFDTFAKENAFGRAIDGWIKAFEYLKAVVRSVQEAYIGFRRLINPDFGRNVTGVAEGGYRTAKTPEEYGQNLSESMRRIRGGTRALSGDEEDALDARLGKDPMFHALTRSGQFETVERLYGPYGGKTSKEVKIEIGQMTVGSALPEGLSPDEFVKRLSEEIDQKLSSQNSTAYEAAR